MEKLERKVKFLTAYVIFSTLIFGAVILCSFTKTNKENFDEINVKRINLLAEDGSLRMVISNETRQHPGRVKGKDEPKRERPAGIIFFNTEGDECGGLIYSADHKDGAINSGMSFTMDQYQHDQVVQITNDETYKNGKAETTRGLLVNQIPTGADFTNTMEKLKALRQIKDSAERTKKITELIRREGIKNRLFIGKTQQNNYGLFLSDSTGKIRLKLYVDSSGNAVMQSLDNNGNVKNILANK